MPRFQKLLGRRPEPEPIDPEHRERLDARLATLGPSAAASTITPSAPEAADAGAQESVSPDAAEPSESPWIPAPPDPTPVDDVAAEREPAAIEAERVAAEPEPVAATLEPMLAEADSVAEPEPFPAEGDPVPVDLDAGSAEPSPPLEAPQLVAIEIEAAADWEAGDATPERPEPAREPHEPGTEPVVTDPGPASTEPAAVPASTEPAAVAAPIEPAAEAAPTEPAAEAAASPAPARARVRSAPVARRPAPSGSVATAALCPYCAEPLDPMPVASTRCQRCRQRIVVRRTGERTILLTEAAVPVFEAQRRRAVHAPRWTRERDRWLERAATSGSSPERIARIAREPVSEDAVARARALYVATIEQAARTARRERRWAAAGKLSWDLAATLYRVARSPRPVPDEVLAVHRNGLAATLRGISEVARTAELRARGCCDACRADEGREVRISAELKEPTLPHAGCPRGLCRCRWFLADRDRTYVSGLLRRQTRPGATRSTTRRA